MGNLIESIKHKRAKATAALMVAGTSAMSFIAPAFAEGQTADPFGGLFETLKNTFVSVKNGLYTIVGPIAIACAIFCLIMMLISKDQKKMEGYKSWLIAIVVCVVLIYAVPAIINWASAIGQNINGGAS